MADPQTAVQALLDDLVTQERERGLQVAAYLDGELVVDAWSGVADPASGRPVDGETLFNVFSATKGITATVIHLLAERGRVAYDEPVARYWPEFGVHGKERITVRHVLTHSAGVPQLPDGTGPADLCNWEGLCRGVAALTPLWEPGTATGYHAITYGIILGEVAHRADGRPIDAILREEICAPLGLTDPYLGIPDEVEPRVAWLEGDPARVPPPPPPPDALILRALPPSLLPLERMYNWPEVRRAVLPSGGGTTSARGLARVYAALIGAVPGGDRLLSPERLRQATTLQTEAVDRATGRAPRKALGYWLGGLLSPMGNKATAFGHSGYGGAIGFADPEHRFAFALTKNRMVESRPGESAANLVATAARRALGIPEGG